MWETLNWCNLYPIYNMYVCYTLASMIVYLCTHILALESTINYLETAVLPKRCWVGFQKHFQLCIWISPRHVFLNARNLLLCLQLIHMWQEWLEIIHSLKWYNIIGRIRAVGKLLLLTIIVSSPSVAKADTLFLIWVIFCSCLWV